MRSHLALRDNGPRVAPAPRPTRSSPTQVALAGRCPALDLTCTSTDPSAQPAERPCGHPLLGRMRICEVGTALGRSAPTHMSATITAFELSGPPSPRLRAVRLPPARPLPYRVWCPPEEACSNPLWGSTGGRDWPGRKVHRTPCSVGSPAHQRSSNTETGRRNTFLA